MPPHSAPSIREKILRMAADKTGGQPVEPPALRQAVILPSNASNNFNRQLFANPFAVPSQTIRSLSRWLSKRSLARPTSRARVVGPGSDKGLFGLPSVLAGIVVIWNEPAILRTSPSSRTICTRSRCERFACSASKRPNNTLATICGEGADRRPGKRGIRSEKPREPSEKRDHASSILTISASGSSAPKTALPATSASAPAS